jgi:hypothetical protein
LGDLYATDPYDARMVECTLGQRMTGDQLYVFRSELLKRQLFPTDVGRFVPERLVYHKVGHAHVFRHRNVPAQFKEYRSDGLTAKVYELRVSSPLAAVECYWQDLKITKQERYVVSYLRALLNYGRFLGVCWSTERYRKKSIVSLRSLTPIPRTVALIAAVGGWLERLVKRKLLRSVRRQRYQ